MSTNHTLIVAFAPGVTVTKWARIWAERHPEVPLTLLPTTQTDQTDVVLDGTAHLSFVRLPVAAESLHVILLYRERAVAVAAKNHLIAAADEVTLADLAGETVLQGGVTHTDRDAFDLVAAGVGILIVPHAIARQQSRKDVVVRPVVDAEETQIALVWQADQASDSQAELIEDFIGIVRGRTARSSRSGEAVEPAKAVAKSATLKPTLGKANVQSDASQHARKRKQAAARKKRRGR